MTSTATQNSWQVTDVNEGLLRANTYTLLARLLRETPDSELLTLLSRIETGQQPVRGLGLCWQLLKLSAEHARPEDIDDEFHNLFIGMGHGEVIPYGSWYQTGYLMDTPLARLRSDLVQLGIERRERVSEPEDHVAAVCEAMAILIDRGAALDVQQRFFRTHMHGWLVRCFADIEQAASAHFYKAVGKLGQHFIELEVRYLEVLDA